MSPDLPTELWLHIFSFLDVEELMRARDVCRRWWEVIDCDVLWKPRLLKRGFILTPSNWIMKAKSSLPSGHDSARLTTKHSRRTGRTVDSSRLSSPLRLAASPFTCPSVILTFDRRVKTTAEVYRLVGGKFEIVALLPLTDQPIDDYRGCEPCMTSDNVFGISMRTRTVVFKLIDGQFRFAKSVGGHHLIIIQCAAA
uniref:F-box/WD repeat-containing protein pof1 n=2 Tax=Lygus hesperus TaxID=30085 RepID=A0A0A9YHC4_LYGHE